MDRVFASSEDERRGKIYGSNDDASPQQQADNGPTLAFLGFLHVGNLASFV
jgi:hypothetical protein